MGNLEKIYLSDEGTNEESDTEKLILREYAPRTPEQLKLDLLANIVIIKPVTPGTSYLGVR